MIIEVKGPVDHPCVIVDYNEFKEMKQKIQQLYNDLGAYELAAVAKADILYRPASNSFKIPEQITIFKADEALEKAVQYNRELEAEIRENRKEIRRLREKYEPESYEFP